MFARRLPLPLLLRASVRHNSTEAAPPLLATLRTDLKVAMRSKNQVQLAVLRNLLAEIKNAQLSENPPKGDIGILQIINKARARAADTIKECREAKREDLVEKEQAQLAVMEEYAGLVETISKEGGNGATGRGRGRQGGDR